jgi:hypothetical protein
VHGCFAIGLCLRSADPNPNSYSQSHTDTFSYANTYAYPDSYAHPHTHTNPDAYPNSYADASRDSGAPIRRNLEYPFRRYVT